MSKEYRILKRAFRGKPDEFKAQVKGLIFWKDILLSIDTDPSHSIGAWGQYWTLDIEEAEKGILYLKKVENREYLEGRVSMVKFWGSQE